jgi:hypothetical protein
MGGSGMSATSRKCRITPRKRRASRATSRKRRYRKSTFKEACDKADAEQGRRLEFEEVACLARLSKLEYDRQREEAAERLGVRVATLDKAVSEKRASADNDDGALPHWKVEPSPERYPTAQITQGAESEAPMREAQSSPPANRGARVVGTDAMHILPISQELSDGQERTQDNKDKPNINAHQSSPAA